MTAASTAMPTFWRISVSPKRDDLDVHGHAVLRDIHELGLPHVRSVSTSRLFFLEGQVPSAAVKRIAAELLADPITEVFSFRAGGEDLSGGDGFDAYIEVHLKGGVMDPVAASTLMAIGDMGAPIDGLEVATGRRYRLAGVRDIEEASFIARRLLSNDCIEDVYLSGFGRRDPLPARLPRAPVRPFELRHVALRKLDDEGLRKLSREGHLFLSLDEMHTLRDHYRGLDRDPTDLELETFAQTWSEHCVHKTLKSAVRYVGAPMPESASLPGGAKQAGGAGGPVEITYHNLLKDTVARATRELIDSGRVDWCLSVFEDNAGIIVFDDDFGVAVKVETHNHPSAIEPYGGAATGVGGCIRDIMGCGLGAKPIANTDVFCVATPDFPMDLLPKGVLHPRRVLKGVVAGVRDYGNRMGIPTINGAVLFDDRYLGNPLVFCGCVGLIPRDRIKKAPRPGDLVVVIGGRTGRDGIHGATFSSAELTDTHADEFSHAVQIGNAITEKQVLDAMLQARDHASGCLYTATTDCGAGGLSSAVGEMAAELGAEVDLEKVPLKYAGLRYDEIWISEAQERMVLSVPPENWAALQAICRAENVEATAFGTFRDDGQLVIRYQGSVVGEIDCRILHDGIPKTRREAAWAPVAAGAPAGRSRENTGTNNSLTQALSSLDAASKEWIIRQYDHEVQGASVIKPLVGPGEGPSDGAVIRPRLDSRRGVALACGICPKLSELDPYWMAVAAIDEAIRNVVCVGGDPKQTAILDNFCWGNCDDPRVMGALVRACQGCYDASITHGTPFISGKDSLNNEFALDPADAAKLAERIGLHNNRIRIPATLLISAISVIDDVARCVTMDAKPVQGARFLFVGLAAKSWTEARIADTAALHRAVAGWIGEGLILAAHDCGDDGILPALAEMAFAGKCGIACEPGFERFTPVTSGYVVQVSKANAPGVLAGARELDGVTAQVLGTADGGEHLLWEDSDGTHMMSVSHLAEQWRKPLAW